MTSTQPPQTPIGPPRQADAPHKTPFRTPLCTPGGVFSGEQVSHTPIIDFEAIEQHKENVQPLARGRSAHALTAALSQRHAELKAQRQELEEIVTSQENADSDDPLEAWAKYVKWCIDSYPGGQTSESGLVLLLERCTRLFRHSAQYRNDSRYLRLWILYGRNVDCPADVYNFLMANEIGTALASLYEELAAVHESQSAHDKADEAFRIGIHRSAQPLDRLKRRYQEYQKRILTAEGRSEKSDRQTYKVALASAMAKAQRSMLGSKSGATSASANTLRGQGVTAGIAQAQTENGNVKRPTLFKDADGEKSKAWAQGKPPGKWSDIGTSTSRKQERDSESRGWKGEVLPQRDANATPRRTAIPIYRDSDDEDEAVESPAKQRSGDVFSKSREISDTDKLRRNPFSNYKEDELNASRHESLQKPSRELEKGAPDSATLSRPADRPQKASSSSLASKSKAKASVQNISSGKQEKYAAPLEMIYPGIALDRVGQKSSHKKRSFEVCMEELIYSRKHRTPAELNDDPWSYLDASEGKWLPELKRVSPISKAPRMMQRDPTVTVFTRAAQEEVMEMFNGGTVNSDEESSDEESDSEQGDDQDAFVRAAQEGVDEYPGGSGADIPQSPSRSQLVKDSENASTGSRTSLLTSTSAGAGRAFEAVKETFGMSLPSLTPLARRIGHDDDALDDADDSIDQACEEYENGKAMSDNFMNRPMCELAPLSPITEATEFTRTTQLSRTPGTTTSSRLAGRSWTPTALAGRIHEEEDNFHCEEYDKSHLEESKKGPVSQPEFFTVDNGYDIRSREGFEMQGIQKGALCPVDADIIDSVLQNLDLPLQSSKDYVDCHQVVSSKLSALQRRAAQVGKRRSSGHTTSSAASTNEWKLEILEHTFHIRQKLGEGAYGAVFLAEDPSVVSGKQRIVGGINGDASFADLGDDADESMDADLDPKLIAIKVESPPNRWEFYILGQLRARLTDETRLPSMICARKFFCFQDESFLLLEYGDKGTLLEIVNNATMAGVASSSVLGLGSSVPIAAGNAVASGHTPPTAAATGIDEILAMFFTVEVIKLVEALHAVDLLHGDLKIDNCLLRLDDDMGQWTHAYNRAGANGWATKGITLIDFGRAIDLRQFSPDQRFLADWSPEPHDSPRIQKAESWRHDIDYFGIASIAYCLLFGKHICTVASTKAGVEHAIDRPLRRYWQVETWNTLFSLCLNCPDDPIKASTELSNVRERMETWLEDNCFRAGKNLKGSLKKLEIWSMKRSQ